jgi:hypothetical protein
MTEMLPVLIGGLCAILGGFLSTWYMAKNARKIRMEEIIGEKQVEIYKEALSAIGYLNTCLLLGTTEDSQDFIEQHEKWFWDSRAFLPQKFADNWVSIKLSLRQRARMQKSHKDESDITKIELHIGDLAEEARKEILNILNLQPITVHRLPKT